MSPYIAISEFFGPMAPRAHWLGCGYTLQTCP